MADETTDDIDTAANRTNSATDKAADVANDAADKVREASEQVREAFSDKVVDPARRAGEAMKASGQKLVEGGSTIGTRMIDQAEQNAREAFAAMRAAAGAKDFSDVMRIQGEFLREQGTRSMVQAREIGELIVQFGKDAVAPLRGSAANDEML